MKQDWQNKTFIDVKILGLYNFYSFMFSAFPNILKEKLHMPTTSHLSLWGSSLPCFVVPDWQKNRRVGVLIPTRV